MRNREGNVNTHCFWKGHKILHQPSREAKWELTETQVQVPRLPRGVVSALEMAGAGECPHLSSGKAVVTPLAAYTITHHAEACALRTQSS